MRFKGFEGEWDEQRLGKLSEISSGGTPSRNTPAFWNGKIPWITTSLINFNVIKEANEFITEQGVKESSAKLFPKNTILMAMYGQGKTRGQVAIMDIEATTNQACAAIMPNAKLIDYSFLFQNLSKRYDEIRELSNQGGQQNLSGGIIKEIEISFPSLSEQQKVASFLSLIDQRIITQSKIIQRLETSMQNLRENLLSQKIRFKDSFGVSFANWEVKKLGDISTKKSSNISANKIEENSGEYIIYGASGILKKVDFYEEENDYISIIKDGAGVGRLFYCKGKSSVLGTMDIIKPNFGINTYFLFCLISSIDFTKYISGSTIPHIYFKDYRNESCQIPCLDEQNYISDFLLSVINKLELEKQLLLKYEHQRKYLLQNLFI